MISRLDWAELISIINNPISAFLSHVAEGYLDLVTYLDILGVTVRDLAGHPRPFLQLDYRYDIGRLDFKTIWWNMYNGVRNYLASSLELVRFEFPYPSTFRADIPWRKKYSITISTFCPDQVIPVWYLAPKSWDCHLITPLKYVHNGCSA